MLAATPRRAGPTTARHTTCIGEPRDDRPPSAPSGFPASAGGAGGRAQLCCAGRRVAIHCSGRVEGIGVETPDISGCGMSWRGAITHAGCGEHANGSPRDELGRRRAVARAILRAELIPPCGGSRTFFPPCHTLYCVAVSFVARCRPAASTRVVEGNRVRRRPRRSRRPMDALRASDRAVSEEQQATPAAAATPTGGAASGDDVEPAEFSFDDLLAAPIAHRVGRRAELPGAELQRDDMRVGTWCCSTLERNRRVAVSPRWRGPLIPTRPPSPRTAPRPTSRADAPRGPWTCSRCGSVPRVVRSSRCAPSRRWRGGAARGSRLRPPVTKAEFAAVGR